jgi:DNA-binding FadR family transcriptional regulator
MPKAVITCKRIKSMSTQSPVGLAGGDTPSLARARELFGRVINGGYENPSTSSSIADRIQQRVCVAPENVRSFTETVISQDFGVGRRMARQTSRILQLRGIVTPRRGGNGLGGLWVATPSLEQTLAAAGAEIDFRGSDDAIGEAQSRLLPAVADRDDALALLVRSLLLGDGFPPADAVDMHCQASRLAGHLQDEIALSPGIENPLGSLASIAMRFEVSLEIAIEAVRLLADAQLVEVRRGRSGGVFSRPAHAGRALHMVNAFLATNRISTTNCRQVLDRINIEMIELARDRKTSKGLDLVENSFKEMQQAANATELGKAWYGFIRDIADMAGNPVLHFLARAVASSILMRRTRSAELPDAAARELLAASQHILDHLRSGRAVAVDRAQTRCQRALENYW